MSGNCSGASGETVVIGFEHSGAMPGPAPACLRKHGR
jgi:hypothetical protein